MAVSKATVLVSFISADTIPASSTHQTAVPVPLSYQAASTLTYGTAANQAQKSAYFSGSLVSTSVDLDLTTIACSDGTTGFSAIRSVVIVNTASVDGRFLTVGNATSNAWSAPFGSSTHTAVVPPGGRWIYEKTLGTAGSAVDSSNRYLKLNSGANTVPYQVFVLGS